MKFRNFVLACIILSVAAAAARAQFGVTCAVSGRVVTASGAGVRRARVTALNLTTLESHAVTTNDFGYFRIDGLPVIDLHLLSVSSKRYSFLFPNQLFQFSSAEHSTFFIAND